MARDLKNMREEEDAMQEACIAIGCVFSIDIVDIMFVSAGCQLSGGFDGAEVRMYVPSRRASESFVFGEECLTTTHPHRTDRWH